MKKSNLRQPLTVYWKSCVSNVGLMEEEVEELALRLPYPHGWTMMCCLSAFGRSRSGLGGVREVEKVVDKEDR